MVAAPVVLILDNPGASGEKALRQRPTYLAREACAAWTSDEEISGHIGGEKFKRCGRRTRAASAPGPSSPKRRFAMGSEVPLTGNVLLLHD